MTNITKMLEACLDEKNWRHIATKKLKPFLPLRALIMMSAGHIGQPVVLNNHELTLTWHDIANFAKDHNIPPKSFEKQLAKVFLHDFVTQRCTQRLPDGTTTYTLTYRSAGDVNGFMAFLKMILPILSTDYPCQAGNTVTLTQEQYHYCAFHQMCKQRSMPTSYLGDDHLLKTLRADEKDFSLQFIYGIIPTAQGTRRHKLRHTQRSPYIITPSRRVSSRLNRHPTYHTAQKKGFSQNQSTTWIDKHAENPPFGFSNRGKKLYGLLTHQKDALLNRGLLNDFGTVSRLFEFKTPEQAQQKKVNFFSPMQLNEFKEHDRAKHKITNEFLARLRFNPHRSMVAICHKEALAARLLAYDFALELRLEYITQAKAFGVTVNPNYNIPIVFYVPNTPTTHLKFYTKNMRRQDLARAQFFYRDTEHRRNEFHKNNYELLLALPLITLAILLEPIEDEPLAMHMIKNGYIRLLLRLLRPEKNNPISQKALFDYLIQHQYIIKNDSTIAELIRVEAFDLANQVNQVIKQTPAVPAKESLRDFIKMLAGTAEQTHSDDLSDLPVRYSQGGDNLLRHFIRYGNPRQLNFIGMRKSLLKAAELDDWVCVTLCLKEYPKQSADLLGELLWYACKNNAHEAAEFLIKAGANTSVTIEKQTPIQQAANQKDLTMLAILSYYPTDENDQARYGYALLVAMRNGQRALVKMLLQQGAKPHWRNTLTFKRYDSTLCYAIMYRMIDLIPELYAHEAQDRNHLDARVKLAYRFALERNDQQALAKLQELHDCHVDDPFDPQRLLTDIYQEFFAALFMANLTYAKKLWQSHLNQLSVDSLLFTMQQHEVDSHTRTCIDDNLVQFLFEQGSIEHIKWLRKTSATTSVCRFIASKLVGDDLQVNPLAKSLANTFGNCEHWQYSFDRQYTLAVYNSNYEKATLLLKLGATPNHEKSICIDSIHYKYPIEVAAHHNKIGHVFYLLDSFDHEPKSIENLMLFSQTKDNKLLFDRCLDCLPSITDTFLTSIGSICTDSSLLAILNKLDATRHSNQKIIDSLTTIWCQNIFNDPIKIPKSMTEITKILGETEIKNTALHTLATLFQDLIQNTKKWPHLKNSKQNKIHLGRFKNYLKQSHLAAHSIILNKLNFHLAPYRQNKPSDVNLIFRYIFEHYKWKSETAPLAYAYKYSSKSLINRIYHFMTNVSEICEQAKICTTETIAGVIRF